MTIQEQLYLLGISLISSGTIINYKSRVIQFIYR